MFAPFALCVVCVQPGPPPYLPPAAFGGIVTAGDYVTLEERDGRVTVRALSAAEADALRAGEAALTQQTLVRFRELAAEAGVELPADPTQEELWEAYRRAAGPPRGGVTVRGRGGEGAGGAPARPREEMSTLLRATLASRATAPRPVLRVTADWLTYLRSGSEVVHLPLHRVASVIESPARFAERTGATLPEEPEIDPAAADAAVDE